MKYPHKRDVYWNHAVRACTLRHRPGNTYLALIRSITSPVSDCH